MNKLKSFLLLSATFLIALMACDPGRIFDQTYTVPESGWDRDSVFHYSVDISDSLLLHDFYISIRNNTNYPYSNIYFFLSTEFPNGHSTTDTIECILAGKDGRWLGNGSGAIKDNLILLQRGLRFPITGQYHFYIEQAMRDEQLKGIEDVGLRIEKTGL
ncbi:MAG: gliding motility lipoprotein GldH [Bacteroidales bacterium]|nr:gliding motility lipoprotein GldH [Bacteroidales bacterium]